MAYKINNCQSSYQLTLPLFSDEQNLQFSARFQLSQKLSRNDIIDFGKKQGIPTKEIKQCKIGQFVRHGPWIILHVKTGHWEAIKLIAI